MKDYSLNPNRYRFMDSYEVHKKVQEAIMALEIYFLNPSRSSSVWHTEIMKGLDALGKQRQTLDDKSSEKPRGN